MPDISICSNTACPMKYRCGRYLCKPDKHWQSYSGFQPIAMKCDGFWDVADFPYQMDGCKAADERNEAFNKEIEKTLEENNG